MCVHIDKRFTWEEHVCEWVEVGYIAGMIVGFSVLHYSFSMATLYYYYCNDTKVPYRMSEDDNFLIHTILNEYNFYLPSSLLYFTTWQGDCDLENYLIPPFFLFLYLSFLCLSPSYLWIFQFYEKKLLDYSHIFITCSASPALARTWRGRTICIKLQKRNV